MEHFSVISGDCSWRLWVFCLVSSTGVLMIRYRYDIKIELLWSLFLIFCVLITMVISGLDWNRDLCVLLTMVWHIRAGLEPRSMCISGLRYTKAGGTQKTISMVSWKAVVNNLRTPEFFLNIFATLKIGMYKWWTWSENTYQIIKSIIRPMGELHAVLHATSN